MFRSHSNYIKGNSSHQYSWLKYIITASCWLALGVVIGKNLNGSTLSSERSQKNLSQASSVASKVSHSPKPKRLETAESDNQAKKCRQALEGLHIKLKDTKSRLELFDNASQLLSFLNHLRITEFELAELKHAYNLDQQKTKVCLLKRSGITIKNGDLVVSQGALIGEIVNAENDCFDMISVESEQSSYEVVLEQSGVKGIAIGLGSRSIDLENNRFDKASIELKYLERAVPAIIGERALLVRKHQTADKNYSPSPAHTILSPLTVGEVVDARIDENGLFQSALLASSLSQTSVSLVAIISASNPFQSSGNPKTK